MMLDTPYASAVYFRNLLYDKGILKSYLVPPLVVSIGNIEAGGTGKTPFTMALAGELKALGHKTAIVTRGYRGRLHGPIEVCPSHDYLDVGDEPLLMARTTGVPVIKSPDRCMGATFAHRKCGSEIVLLDDGFQHRRIFRDLNICLVSGTLENERLLPAGRLREPVTSLKRADFIIDTNKDARMHIEGIIDLRGRLSSEIIPDKIFAFCGIANPQRFFDTLRQLCAGMKTMVFADHHKYKASDIRKIKKAAKGFDMIVTTEKDFVRLNPLWIDDRVHALRVSMRSDKIMEIIREIEGIAENRRISRQR
jgi:tetraacyldisaccharide 4'-kinase